MPQCSRHRQVHTSMQDDRAFTSHLGFQLRQQRAVSQTLIVLLVMLAQGIVRLTVVPLWAHYDEPSHYEALRMMMLYRQMPTTGEMDPVIFNEIAATFR